MSKSLSYWREKWDNSEHKEEARKTLDLLSEYAGFFKHQPVTGFAMPWGGTLGRFFSGRWNTTHGDEVQNAIHSYFEVAGSDAHTEGLLRVDVILSKVKNQIKSPINPDGDLAKILTIIKEKTKVDYFNNEEMGWGELREKVAYAKNNVSVR